jgi:hypothetical protein
MPEEVHATMNGISFALLPDRLLSSVMPVLDFQSKYSDRDMRQALGEAATADPRVNRRLVAARLQVAWYQRFQGGVPAKIQATLEQCEAERQGATATVGAVVPVQVEDSLREGAKGPTELARRLLGNGVTDPDLILRATQESYPDKKFTRSDLKRLQERISA